MKRLTVILLTFFYLFSSLGVAAKSMYCMGVLTKTTLTYTEVKAPCKMAGRKCCKTKKQYFKVTDQHYGSATVAFLAKLFPVFVYFSKPDTTHVESECYYHAYNSHAPPLVQQTPVYILNCTFRI